MSPENLDACFLSFFFSFLKVEPDFQSHLTDLFYFKILPFFLSVSEKSQNTTYAVMFVFRLG